MARENTPPEGEQGNVDLAQQKGNEDVKVDLPKTPPAPSGKKKRVKCETIKGQSIIIGADTIQVDENGVIEVDAVQAERLLTIPGWEEA